jgi:hypothetical protein
LSSDLFPSGKIFSRKRSSPVRPDGRCRPPTQIAGRNPPAVLSRLAISIHPETSGCVVGHVKTAAGNHNPGPSVSF